jgi:membrane-bound ClpP family serine protease
VQLSRQSLWAVLAIETASLSLLALWVLWQFDKMFEPYAILIAVGIVLVGDVVSALLLQRYAPTRITVEPGEGTSIFADVLCGFQNSRSGEIIIKGERWRARLEEAAAINPGDRVEVVARVGLTMLIRATD